MPLCSFSAIIVLVLQDQVYQTVRVHYGARPAASWENHNTYIWEAKSYDLQNITWGIL